MSRVVIKMGTRVVIDPISGLDHLRLKEHIHLIQEYHKKNHEIILVSSGAVELGRRELGLERPLSLEQKQACAAIGQTHLMHFYQSLFSENKIVVAQLLLTARDLADRKTYLNLRNSFETLLSHKVIPIVNENDPLSTSELKTIAEDQSFGDNDKLSALVAAKLAADFLVILTDVDGIYKKDPRFIKDAQKISKIQKLSELKNIDQGKASLSGRGGMSTKMEASRIGAISGVTVVIASGFKNKVLENILFHKNESEGTWILPQPGWSYRKQWIGFTSGYHGILYINEGAKEALVHKGSSLLAVGVIGMEGQFHQGQVVSVQLMNGEEVGRGIVQFHLSDLEKIKGLQSQKIKEILGASKDEVIHRDDLVIFEEEI